MDENEVNRIVIEINAIQRKAYVDSLTNYDRDLWRKNVKLLGENGYKLKKYKKNVCGNDVWRAVKFNEDIRNSECNFVYTNVRPDHKTLIGDCTTRVMAFCLSGIMTYDEIEREQYRLAAKYNSRRNKGGIWEKILDRFDYKKIYISNTTIKRSKIANMLKNIITNPIITHSSGHVAVIDTDGNVRDTWDSRGGRVNWIIAKSVDIEKIKDCLNRYVYI